MVLRKMGMSVNPICYLLKTGDEYDYHTDSTFKNSSFKFSPGVEFEVYWYYYFGIVSSSKWNNYFFLEWNIRRTKSSNRHYFRGWQQDDSNRKRREKVWDYSWIHRLRARCYMYIRRSYQQEMVQSCLLSFLQWKYQSLSDEILHCFVYTKKTILAFINEISVRFHFNSKNFS